MDSSGDQHLHIEHNIFKRRIDLNGNTIDGKDIKEEVQSSTKFENVTDTQQLDIIKCGSCCKYPLTIIDSNPEGFLGWLQSSYALKNKPNRIISGFESFVNY
jgi:hypothetical protein